MRIGSYRAAGFKASLAIFFLLIPLAAHCSPWNESDPTEPASACDPKGDAAASAAASPRKIPVYWRAFQELVEDARGKRRFLEPEEVIQLGADIVAGGSFTGIPIDVPRTQRLRDNMAAARRLASQKGLSLCQLILSRPDHYVELEGAARVPGFSDEWIFRTAKAEYEKDVRRFESRGWTIGPEDYVSKEFIARITRNSETMPNFYGPVARGRRKYHINGVLVDLRNPEYRRWQLDWLQSLVDFVGADAVAVGIKTGWHAKPMYHPKASPRGRHGGPLSDTPYGEGEYEAAITAWLLEAKARGLRVAVRDSTPGPGGPGAWFPRELEAAIVGHYDPILLSKSARVRALVRGYAD